MQGAETGSVVNDRDETDLTSTTVTAKAREAFHAAVPGCRIHYDGGIIEPRK